MTISFKEKEKILEVYKDNNLISEIAVNQSRLKEGKVDFIIQNDSLLVKEILQSNAKSYPRNLRLADHSDDLASFSTLENGIYVSKKINVLTIVYKYEHNFSEWNFPFSITEFNEYFRWSLGEKGIEVDTGDFFELDILQTINALDDDRPIIDVLESFDEKIIECTIEETKIALTKNNAKKLLIKIFDFPPEYKNICSQYLIWFGEFLENLGVEADVSTENKGGKTFLVVSPVENVEMLEKIEQLFYQYVSLPYVEVLPPRQEMSSLEQHTFLAVKQQIQMLEMQIESKDSVIENKKSTIVSLNATITSHANTIDTQAGKLTLLNALVDKDKWSNVPFTEGTFKCKDLGKKTMSIQFEPLAIFKKLIKDKNNED